MKDLKAPFFTVLFVVLGLIVYTKIFGPIPFYVNNIQTTKTSLFHAQGTGKAVAAPDTATITVGITQDASTVSEAQNKVNSIINKIIEDIKKLGIEEKNIKTENYSVYPKQGRNRVEGYTVSQNLEIKVKPIEKINQVIDISVSGGANILNQSTFGFSDELKKKLEDQARKEAVRDAKVKAESLANAAGIKIGKVIDVTESSQDYSPRPLLQKTIAPADAEGNITEPTTTITPGENTISIIVDIFYETY
ncbi:SIMPL domain-containing protein [Patescibacteria group bacterium]|nr:SIMPL domain-containing protein [Patescibacteria group bacterium]